MTMRIVPVPISDQDRLKLLHLLSVAKVQIENLEEGIAEEKARVKEQIGMLDAEMERIFRIVRSGKEDREVDVEEVFIQETLEVELRLVGTGELITSRPMNQE